jgi:hypothetical protein
MLVLGVVIFAFSIPSVISAFTEGRPPRLAAILFVIGGGLIAYSISKTPGGIGFDDIPQAFARVIGRFRQ